MNRVIKFRAWTGERMIPMMFDAGQSVGNGFWYPWGFDVGVGGKIPQVYMQFTGILDKNGKEIYEGDIIKSKGSNKNLEIFWNEFECGFDIKSYDGRVGRVVIPPAPHRKKWQIGAFCEVIGNIYQNPELLTPK